MKATICVTVFNEEKTITKFLDSLANQTMKANEIIVVDAGSHDGTATLVRKYKEIKLVISNKASIAKGRNIAINNAANHIIAMTDAGCLLDKNWLKRITEPFRDKRVDVVAGFYKMTGKTDFQIALKPFLGVMPQDFNVNNFLPSTRSIAFRKDVWKKVKGFNEKFDKAGEDTNFNLKLIKSNFQIKRVKNATVDWEVPSNFMSAMEKFYYYARGDAQSRNFLSRHNIKVVTIFLRYIIFLLIKDLLIIYIFVSIYKHRKFTNNWQQRIYTVIIQLGSDFSIMAGFLNGIF